MTKVEDVAGSLLAPMFIYGGWDACARPESKVKAAEPVTKALSSRLSFLPDDPAALVRFNGAVQVGAGVLMAAGLMRRLAALVLAGSLIPTTYAGHSFWTEVEDGKRTQQRIHFLKNSAMLGGLLLLALGRGHASKNKPLRAPRSRAPRLRAPRTPRR